MCRRRRKRFGYLSLWAKSWLKAISIALDNAHYNLSRSTKSRQRPRHTKSTSHYCRRIYSSRKTGAIIFDKVARHKSTSPAAQPTSYNCAARTYTATNDDDGTSRTHALPASFDSDSFQIAIDNCASYCMTNCEDDFIDKPKPINRPVTGLGHQTATKTGTVKWHITDDDGKVHAFTIPGVLLLPNLPFRVLSPQHWSQTLHRPSHCITFKDSILLTWNGGDNKRTIRLSSDSNVGILKSAPSYTQATAFISEVTKTSIPNPFEEATCFPATDAMEEDTAAIVSDDEDDDDETIQASNRSNGGTTMSTEPTKIDFHDDNVDSNENSNFPERALSDDEAELMRWHLRLGHTSFDKLRVMANNSDIPKRLAGCKIPKCAGCLYGKMTRRAWRTKQKPSKVEPATITAPGDCVSVDQLESTSPGFIGQMKGALTIKRYKFATVFVDHWSRLSYVHLQQTNSSIETLEAKRAFEKYANAHAINVKHYHADNGRFADNLWLADIANRGQSISFCGVNAHFQNGVAEKRIRDLQEAARTILLDAKSRWPKAISACLWPYALRHANHAHAQTPSRTKHHGGRTPYEIFVKSSIRPNVKDFHPFGCPIYVLEDHLATGKAIPKWMPRARLGIYLGFSTNHARNVALVLNPTTGLVSPQYHVRFDDLFETTRNPRNNAIDLATWQVKAGFKERHDGQVINVKPVETITTTITPAFPREHQFTEPVVPTTVVADDNIIVPEGVNEIDDTINEFDNEDLRNNKLPQQRAEPESLRRTTRTRRPTEAMRSYLETRDLAFPIAFESLAEIGLWEFESDDPIAYMAKSGDPDTMYLDQALKAPDSKQFIQAMVDEVSQHEERGHWEMIPRSEVPDGTKVLPAVWSMKRKRRVATGEVYKHKARLNIGGHKQEHGVNFWETYSPVVNWFTIRFFLTLSLMFNWHTRQIDFVLAFPQADVECDMYMAIPRGFSLPEGYNAKDYCLKLKKNVYGSKQAGRIWNKYLHKGLIAMGFEQSNIDECLYYRGTTMFLVYVDDGIIIDSDRARIDALFLEFKAHNFDVTDEGDLKDYLGVDISPQPDGSLHLSQSKLIEQILHDMNFQTNTSSVPCPARIGEVLSKSSDSDEHKADWHYRSIIGKLNYLEKSTRPDLAFAVHNAARFSIDPREPHTEAVKRICRYLVGSRDKGYYMKPDYNLGFEVFADADFAGTWNKDTAENDPATAQSRAGYLIRLAGCPILWASRLMREICLSTTEAEYCCLSEALRQVIPLINIITELQDRKLLNEKLQPVVKCTAFEDNSGALELARTPRMRPRTKHINIKYHHFRQHVAAGLIKIEPINTLDQLADVFTKAVSRDLFFKFRGLIMGW